MAFPTRRARSPNQGKARSSHAAVTRRAIAWHAGRGAPGFRSTCCLGTTTSAYGHEEYGGRVGYWPFSDLVGCSLGVRFQGADSMGQRDTF